MKIKFAAPWRNPSRQSAGKYFDENYYLSSNPDVAAAKRDPYRHFMQSGWREGRNPSPLFDTLFYQYKIFDNGLPGTNPFLHFLATGEKNRVHPLPASDAEFLEIQKKVVAPFFNEQFYSGKIPPGSAVGSALDHYMRVGAELEIDPSPAFSIDRYLRENSHVRRLKVDPFFHYLMTRGAREAASKAHRKESVADVIASEFDSEYYLSRNPDVRAAGADPVRHYIEHGWREHRDPTPTFWTSYYLATNPEVMAENLNPFYHYLVHGRTRNRKPNPIGTAVWPRPLAPDEALWNRVTPAIGVAESAVVVIVPVYRGYDDTLATIYAVLSNPQRVRFSLLVVNDRSPDRKLTAQLRELHARGLFRYIENEENRGFVGSVNRALGEAPAVDAVLLNSDTVVHGDWLDRIRAHADRDPRIATITPFSNNATICSYPRFDDNNILQLEVSPAALDQFAKAANKGRNSEVPTGVGFCFYMRRSILDEIGKLDEASFARGYGEENDYCLRAAKAGYINILAHDVFVYHTGKVSFSDSAAASYNKGQAALLKKHPDYEMRVVQHAAADPAHEARLRLDLYRLAVAVGPQSMVFVTHTWGGGIKSHIAHLANGLAEENVRVVMMHAGQEGGGDEVSIEAPRDVAVYTPNLGKLSLLKYADLIEEFLGWLQPRGIHVHSFVGLRWRSTARLMKVIADSGSPFFYTAHDFSALCHRNHLVVPEGTFCGQPATTVCRSCARADSAFNDMVDPDDRRGTYHSFLRNAQAVFAPSADTAARLARSFPDVRAVVRPHEDLDRFAPAAVPDIKLPLRVVAIGALGPHKGSAVIYSLALDAQQRSLPIQFKIIGYSNIPERMKRVDVTETGRYDSEAEAVALIREYQPHLVLLPSIWPETFCYTLSLAFALGIPPVVFDLGAQAERVRAAGFGHILDPALIDTPAKLNDLLRNLPLNELLKARSAQDFVSYSSMAEYYGGDAAPSNRYNAISTQLAS